MRWGSANDLGLLLVGFELSNVSVVANGRSLREAVCKNENGKREAIDLREEGLSMEMSCKNLVRKSIEQTNNE